MDPNQTEGPPREKKLHLPIKPHSGLFRPQKELRQTIDQKDRAVSLATATLLKNVRLGVELKQRKAYEEFIEKAAKVREYPELFKLINTLGPVIFPHTEAALYLKNKSGHGKNHTSVIPLVASWGEEAKSHILTPDELKQFDEKAHEEKKLLYKTTTPFHNGVFIIEENNKPVSNKTLDSFFSSIDEALFGVYVGMDAERAVDLYKQRDESTGFHTQTYLKEIVYRELKGIDSPYGIFMVDLDGLKKTNDLLGHTEGNELILSTARVLKETFRTEDIIVRYGGDEFVVVVRGVTEQILKKLNKRLHLVRKKHNKDRETPLSFSVGYELGLPNTDPPTDPEEVFKRADDHMYQSKNARKKFRE